jgi:enediyne biosynthesis protein E4
MSGSVIGRSAPSKRRSSMAARALVPLAVAAGCADDGLSQATTPRAGKQLDAAPSTAPPADASVLDRVPSFRHDARPAESEASPVETGTDAGVDASGDRDLDGGDVVTDVGTDSPIRLPPPFAAKFLWRPITFEGAIDLGHRAEPVKTDAQVASGVVALKEVGEAAGLTTAMSGGNPHGTGVAFVDVDGDDYDDLFLANGQWTNVPPTHFPSALYLNRRDGTFVDATKSSGIETILAGRDLFSVAAADYDADGDIDFYLTSNPKDVLLKNDGTGRFTDVSSDTLAFLPESSPTYARTGRGKIAAWGDLDQDGWLDIAVATSMIPGFTLNGYVLRNKGDGTFEGATASSGYAAAPTGSPCALIWTDYDNDGDQDIQIWNDQGVATENRVLLQNDGASHFTNVTVAANLANYVADPMGIAGADIDRNGYLDYYVSNIGGNPLYLANGDGTFKDIMTEAGVAGSFGWGLGFEDLNADTWPDIFVAQEDDKYDLTFTHQGVVPPKFTPAWWRAAPLLYTGWAHNVSVAFSDYDKNGTIDIVRATTDGSRITLFRNDTSLGSQSFLEVRIGRTPRTGEKGGVSARVVVKTGDVVQFSDIEGSAGKSSSSAVSARFGLGQWTGADWVAAIWPDGRELSALNVPGNRTVVLSAPD